MNLSPALLSSLLLSSLLLSSFLAITPPGAVTQSAPKQPAPNQPEVTPPGAAPAKAAAAPTVYRTVRDEPYAERDGVDPALLSLDVLTVEGAADRPVVVFVHGGGWRIGDKANRGAVRPKARWLVDLGYVFVSVNYRLSPAARHPAHVEDVIAAVAHVRDRAATWGGDPDRIVLMGHSAGAHLAVLAALDRARLGAAQVPPSAIAAVVSLDTAALDVADAVREARLPLARRMYEAAFGEDPQGWADASPRHHLEALTEDAPPPPILLVHSDGRDRARAAALEFARVAADKGGVAEVHEAAGLDHAGVNRRLGEPDEPLTAAVRAFLESRVPTAPAVDAPSEGAEDDPAVSGEHEDPPPVGRGRESSPREGAGGGRSVEGGGG